MDTTTTPQPPQGGWWKRNWKMLVIVGGSLLGILAVIILIPAPSAYKPLVLVPAREVPVNYGHRATGMEVESFNLRTHPILGDILVPIGKGGLFFGEKPPSVVPNKVPEGGGFVKAVVLGEGGKKILTNPDVPDRKFCFRYAPSGPQAGEPVHTAWVWLMRDKSTLMEKHFGEWILADGEPSRAP